MCEPILLATDLDRTLLPNGKHPESPQARALFRQFVTRPEVVLAYVTGRHRGLVMEAIDAYDIPIPQFVIADVGTSLWEVRGASWQIRDDWQQALATDWGDDGHAQLAVALEGMQDLRLQEATKQSAFKLSYYTPAQIPADLLEQVKDRLSATGAQTHLVWSVDETTNTGLLDVLPSGASKLHALEYLRTKLGIPLNNTLFAGDSGNDMDVLVSNIPAVLVANADDSVRAEAVKRGNPDTLYLAQGGWARMNGNYSAGILEGAMHFLPATRAWLDAPDFATVCLPPSS